MNNAEAARILLSRGGGVPVTGDSKLVEACERLHGLGLADFSPAQERPVKFEDRYMANGRTHEALTETPRLEPVKTEKTKSEKTGLLLQIDDNLRVTCSDGMNYIPERRIIAPEELRGKTNENAGAVTWKKLGYLPTLEFALVKLLNHVTSEPGQLDMSEMITFLKKTKLDIIESVQAGK